MAQMFVFFTLYYDHQMVGLDLISCIFQDNQVVGIGSGTTIISAVKTLGEDALSLWCHDQKLSLQYTENFSSSKKLKITLVIF